MTSTRAREEVGVLRWPSTVSPVRIGRWSTRIEVRAAIWTVVSLLAAVAVGIWSLTVGSAGIGLSEVMSAIQGAAPAGTTRIVVEWRLPRVVFALLGGVALAVSGAVFQSVTRNPLGSPDVIGFSAGAYTGVLLVGLVAAGSAVGTLLGALAGALLTGLALYVLAFPQGFAASRILVIGIALSMFLSAFNTWLLTTMRLEQPATVDTMFGQVEIPAPADGELTVVALGWSDAEVALALGVKPVGVFDWQGFGAANKGVGPWATELFGDVEPTILANVGDALDYEAISVLDPDLILNTRSAGDQTQYNRLSTIAPTFSPPAGTAAFGTNWQEQTRLVADALGQSADGAALVTAVQGTITAAAAANPDFTGKTAVAATKFGDGYGAYIAGDARWDLLAALGFVLNPPVLALPTQGFYVPVSAEQISAFDADVAVMFPIGYTLAELEADPLIASLKVVQDGRTVFLAADDQLSQAFSAASPLSIPIAVQGITPQPAKITG